MKRLADLLADRERAANDKKGAMRLLRDLAALGLDDDALLAAGYYVLALDAEARSRVGPRRCVMCGAKLEDSARDRTACSNTCRRSYERKREAAGR